MPPKRASARVAAKATKVPDKAPVSAVTSTVAKGKKRALSDDEDDDDDRDEPVKKRRKKAPKRAVKGKAKAAETNDDKAETVGADTDKKDDSVAVLAKDDKDDEDKPPVPPAKIVSVVKRGSAPVDPESNFVNTHQVYEADGEVWDCMLNQTNVSFNNNKFYVIQLIHGIGNASSILLHTRWGRVGERGQSMQKGPWDAGIAIREFRKQFKNKTSADWSQRQTMVGVPGKYVWLERDFNNDGEKDAKSSTSKPDGEKEKEKEPDVVAMPEVQALIKFIFNSGFINAHLEEMNYDANKLPLGKLAKSTILNGFTALKALAEVLNDPSGDQARSYGGAPKAYEALSNRYYSVIPHSFGRTRPTIINSHPLLKKELEMLDALGDMEIASKVLSNTITTDAKGVPIHPIDHHLAALDLRIIEPLDRSSKEFLALERYTHETHGATHQHFKVKVESIFRIERGGEEERWYNAGYGKIPDGDRMLLWHGSRSTNFAGILKQGLRIAPPEAPVSGYMFGKGAYFADHMSKSANYCYAGLSQNTGLLLLAEVAARPHYELFNAKYDADVDCKAKKALSTKGIGRVQPVDWQDCYEALDNEALKGVVMPKGPGKDLNPPGSYLQYNEYIVYDTAQIRLRYLLKVKMGN